MNETNSLLYSGAVAFDPVVYGVAQGLSQLFPPVEHPNEFVADEASLQESEGMDAGA